MFLSTTLFVLVNCLLKALAICVGVAALLLLKVIVLLSEGAGFLLVSPCMVLQSVGVVLVIPVFV